MNLDTKMTDKPDTGTGTEKANRLTVRLDDEMKRALDNFCARSKRPKASVARDALQELLTNEGFGAPAPWVKVAGN